MCGGGGGGGRGAGGEDYEYNKLKTIRRWSLKQPTYTGSKFNTCDFHRRQLTSYGHYLQLPRHVRSATKDRAPEESVHLATKTSKSSHLSLAVWLSRQSKLEGVQITTLQAIKETLGFTSTETIKAY